MILYKKTSSNLFLSTRDVLRELGSSAKPAASTHQTELIRAAHLAGAQALDGVQLQFNPVSLTEAKEEKLFELEDISPDRTHLKSFQ